MFFLHAYYRSYLASSALLRISGNGCADHQGRQEDCPASGIGTALFSRVSCFSDISVGIGYGSFMAGVQTVHACYTSAVVYFMIGHVYA